MKQYFSHPLLFLLAGFAAILMGTVLRNSSNADQTHLLKKFETVLHKKELQLEQEVQLLAEQTSKKTYAELFVEKPEYYSDLYKEFGFVLLIYENDTLQFWSDNSAAVENHMRTVCLDDKLAKLRNGWFEVIHAKSKSSTKNCFGLLLIKSDYPYQNNYLINDFQKHFSLPNDVRLLNGNKTDPFAILDHSSNYLFSFQFNETGTQNTETNFWSVCLSVIGIVLLIVGFYTLFNPTRIIQSVVFGQSLFFTAALLLLRFISIKFHFPAALYTTHLFDPQHYGDATSFWLPSLGDLLLNTLFILAIAVHFNTSTPENQVKATVKNKQVLAAFLLFGLFTTALIVNKFFISLIANSSISFNINNIFNLNGFSYIGFLIIALLHLSFFLVANRIIAYINNLHLATRSFVNSFFVGAVAFAVVCHLIGYVDWLFIAMPIVITLGISFFKNRNAQDFSFLGIVVIVLLFSLYSVHTFTKEGLGKEREERIVMAEKLAADKDPLTEHLFTEIEKKIFTDTLLSNFLLSSEKDMSAFEKRLRQNYFSGYWDKYDIKFAVFDTSCSVLIKPAGSIPDNITYYDDLIAHTGQETSGRNFYFLKTITGKVSYMAKLPIMNGLLNPEKIATIYAEFNIRFLPEEIGFPELLLDRNMGIDRDLFNYSYAKYKNNELVSQYGKFRFSLTPKQFKGESGKFKFSDIDGYSHLSFSPTINTEVIISKPSVTLFDKITYFSYLFGFYSIVVLLVIVARQIIRRKFVSPTSFKYRIQFLFVTIVLVSLILFGTGTIIYIKQQYEIKNSESISEKINSVAVELESKLGNEPTLSITFQEYSNYLLKKLSSVFFTDINMYDLKGNIYASSQPKIVEEGLASKKMNPDAFLQMAIHNKTQFIHDEEIGNLEYLSAYVPFKGKDGKLLAYLNLPYFAKQTELEKEIAGFLVALINIYIFLFALSVLMAIFISNYITLPLKLIQDKLSKIKLGKINEPITWTDHDEIGNLVGEYNRMISELTHSAELLAKSERESAWREMAKQVAHEIKNPLTPMKLSVQHLQRMWTDKSPDMEQKLQRITQTLIEQIDSLSSIASTFSSFAIMPKANNENINLDEVLQNVISLFREAEGPALKYINEIHAPAIVFADKEQLLRVFNNLIKNAIQATPDTQNGLIIITLVAENEKFKVLVKDNGTGIDKDFIDKIFMPNFTTKSTGMGLGLAMAKNIIESCGGKIWFETIEGRGTTFFITLNKC